jgi:HPt (histidine-containing phosphotransfer) domain-containing protein
MKLEKLIDLTGGDEEFISDLLGTFSENASVRISELNRAIQCRDFHTIKKIAHQLKPSLDLLGADDLFDIAKKLDSEENKNAEDLITDVESLIEGIGFLLIQVNKKLTKGE